MYNTTIEIVNIDESRYTKLIDFLEDNQIIYNETEFEELDTRTKEEKKEDYYMDQNDNYYDEVRMGLR